MACENATNREKATKDVSQTLKAAATSAATGSGAGLIARTVVGCRSSADEKNTTAMPTTQQDSDCRLDTLNHGRTCVSKLH